MLNIFRNRFQQGAVPFFSQFQFSELVLFGSFLFIQILFRFINLDYHGPWADEIATLFFSIHPAETVAADSQSLFYYLLISPLTYFDSDYLHVRLYHGLISFALYLYILKRSRLIMSPSQWIFFNSLYGIHPLVFGFSRLARPYIFLIDLATILIIECRLGEKKRIFWTSFFQMCIYPLSVFPLVIEWLWSKDKKKLAGIFLGASLPCFIYYGYKFYRDSSPVRYIGWIKTTPEIFLNELTKMLFGGYFPYSENLPYHIGPYLLLVFMLLMIASLYHWKQESGRKTLLVFVSAISLVLIGANLLSYLVELRIYRYYVFLFPYFLFALTYSLPPLRSLQLITGGVLGGILLYNTTFNEPYFSRQESFSDLMNSAKRAAREMNAPVFACGEMYHDWYFKEAGFAACSDLKQIAYLSFYDGPLVYVYIGSHRLGGLGTIRPRKILALQKYINGAVVRLAPVKR